MFGQVEVVVSAMWQGLRFNLFVNVYNGIPSTSLFIINFSIHMDIYVHLIVKVLIFWSAVIDRKLTQDYKQIQFRHFPIE